MVVWIDAQLAPGLAVWFRDTLGVPALAVRDPQLRDAEDTVIFHAAREAGAVVLTKDADFVTLLARYEPPPQIVCLTCGNTTNRALRELLTTAWPTAARSAPPATSPTRARRVGTAWRRERPGPAPASSVGSYGVSRIPFSVSTASTESPTARCRRPSKSFGSVAPTEPPTRRSLIGRTMSAE